MLQALPFGCSDKSWRGVAISMATMTTSAIAPE